MNWPGTQNDVCRALLRSACIPPLLRTKRGDMFH